jgi:uncharacterized membrane protein YkoI
VYANAINVRTLVIAAAVVAMLLALGGAGIAYANGGDSEEQVTGPEAQKAKSAAIAAVGGGGTITEVERDDGYGTSGVYEVEVTRDDGSQVEVHLDGDYNVVGQQADEDGPNDNDGSNDD